MRMVTIEPVARCLVISRAFFAELHWISDPFSVQHSGQPLSATSADSQGDTPSFSPRDTQGNHIIDHSNRDTSESKRGTISNYVGT